MKRKRIIKVNLKKKEVLFLIKYFGRSDLLTLWSKMKWSAVSILLFLPVSLFSQEKMLKGATVLENGKSATIKFLLSSTIDNLEWDVDYVNNTIQITISDLGVEGGERFSQIDGEYIKSISSLESSADKSLRVQVAYRNGIKAEDFRERVTLASANRELFLFIKEPLNNKIGFPAVKGYIPFWGQSQKKILDNKEFVLSSNEKVPHPFSGDHFLKASSKIYQAIAGDLFSNKKKASWQKYNIFIIVLLAVIGFLMICIQWRKKKESKKTIDKNLDIKVLNQYRLDSNKSLMIVDVGEKTFLLGVANHSITYLKTLSSINGEGFSDDSLKKQKRKGARDNMLSLHLDKSFKMTTSQPSKKSGLRAKSFEILSVTSPMGKGHQNDRLINSIEDNGSYKKSEKMS